MGKRRWFGLVLLVAVVMTMGSGGCVLRPTATRSPSPEPLRETPVDTPSPDEGSSAEEEPAAATPTYVPTATLIPSEPPPESSGSGKLAFASFVKPRVDAVPVIHHEGIAPDLSNVENPFVLSQAQQERLGKDGFVVSPGEEKEFFTLYEEARYDNVPIFVTSDSLLHVYHLLFEKVLRTAETQHFAPMLDALNKALLARADAQYRALLGSGWEEPAQRVVAYFGVAARLLDGDADIPNYAQELVDAELALIEEAEGIRPSPLFPELDFGEDYTQYTPRGHYTKSDMLRAYFKSMMWYGRMTFRLSELAETRSALLVVHALRTTEVNNRPAMEAWADLYSPTVFFVGRSDDLTVLQYGDVMDRVYGENVTVEELVDEARLEGFISEAKKLPPPRILGIVIGDWQDEEEETKGLRFMGQRFVPDAFIFRQLIYRNVGGATPPDRRGLPNGLDIPAAMGSARAYQHLTQMGETEYANYEEQMNKMRSWLSGLNEDEWTETLYNSWLYAFHPLLEVPGDGYPAFMTSLAWVDKQLNTVMGSFAELKHDTILYAKQAYAELGGGPPPPEPVPPKGYVEPVPEFYARLVALTDMTRKGLDKRGLLVEQDEASLQRLSELAQSLQTMAEKELRGEPLTEEEYETIRFYGGELEHLTMAAADVPEGQPGVGGSVMPEEQPQAAVVADVATDPDPEGDGSANPAVLEMGVGRINHLHAVVPVIEDDGSITLQVAKGGVFSYYEFEWPAEDRLTDEAWREMLERGEAPPRPGWTGSFFTEDREHADLRRGIARFQESLVEAFWYLEPGQLAAADELAAELGADVEALRAEGQYQGRQLIGVDYRSFDRQSETLAVVTVRERWKDTLHEFEDEWPTYGEPAIAERGPYAVDLTYTLKGTEFYGWQVTRVVFDEGPPPWE
jgi:hypothetical protein